MIDIKEFISDFPVELKDLQSLSPWEITNELKEYIEKQLAALGGEYVVHDLVAIHKSAVIDKGATIKGPAIIGEECFVGTNTYLREGVLLKSKVTIGPGSEIKSTIIFSGSTTAHFNFIGNSIIGSNVNFEAGAIVANHFNERPNKKIAVFYQGAIIPTHTIKFGALVGDFSKIGANAVLSPGTLLNRNSIVKRLELVEQVKTGE